MDTYRQDGAAKVYWLTVMTPRDADAARVDEVVNAAIKVAAQPWADQVRIIDTVPVFTPGERYTRLDRGRRQRDDRPRVRRDPPQRGRVVDRGGFGDSSRLDRISSTERHSANQVFSANVCLNCFEPLHALRLGAELLR